MFMREAFCVYACERLEACPSATCGSEIRVFVSTRVCESAFFSLFLFFQVNSCHLCLQDTI